MPVIYRIRIDEMTGRVASRSDSGAEALERNPWWLSLMFTPVQRPGE